MNNYKYYYEHLCGLFTDVIQDKLVKLPPNAGFKWTFWQAPCSCIFLHDHSVYRWGFTSIMQGMPEPGGVILSSMNAYTPRLQVNTIRFGNAKRRTLTCGDKTKTFSFLEISIYWMILKSQNLSHHYFTTLLNYRCNLRGTASPTKN